MVKFNPKNKKQLTYAEALDPAMNITDPEEAAQYLKDYAAFIDDNRTVGMEDNSIDVAKSNLAYWAGYWDKKVRERVERLFSCAHPIFGSIKDNGIPTTKQAFDMGMALGEKHKKENA